MRIEEIRLFRSFVRSFEREVSKQVNSKCNCGVSITQCHALLEIQEKGKCSLNELSMALDLDKSTVSRTIDTLVKEGLVERIIPEKNRRANELSLTHKGFQTCHSINMGNDTYFEMALNEIPENTRNEFINGFKILVEAMSRLNENNC